MAFVDGLVIIEVLFLKVLRLIYFAANPKFIKEKKVVYVVHIILSKDRIILPDHSNHLVAKRTN